MFTLIFDQPQRHVEKSAKAGTFKNTSTVAVKLMIENLRRFKTALIAVLCLGTAGVIASANAASAAAVTAFDRGKEEFNLKRYHAAKAQFMTAIQQNPNNQKAYLFLGRCLEFLREPEDAQATYRACYSVNPFSEEGKRAKQFSMEVAGRLEAADHRAVDSPKQVIDSGLLIQRQALDLQARKIREQNMHARNRRNVSRRQGYFYTPDDLIRRSRNSEVSDYDFIRNSGTIYGSQTESIRAKAHGQKVAQSVQDTANALIERLGRKTHSTSPALRALGTNLYVQYFRSISEEEDIPPPPDPPIELRAKQLQFADIPRAWRSQSKIFKFPTATPGEIANASSKPPTLEQALFDSASTFGGDRSTGSNGKETTRETDSDSTVNSSSWRSDGPQPPLMKEPKPFEWKR